MRVSLIALTLLLLNVYGRPDEPRAWSFDSQRQNPSPPPSEEQQIVALLAKMVDRWNAHDIEGYMETLWNSPDLLCVVDGEEEMGWNTLLASYLRGYPDRNAMGSVFTERTLIQPIKEDVAFAMDWWRATYGPKSHSVYATSTYLLRKIPNEGWKIAAVHTSSVEP
jgi:ketosteroid isomerase-like protein